MTRHRVASPRAVARPPRCLLRARVRVMNPNLNPNPKPDPSQAAAMPGKVEARISPVYLPYFPLYSPKTSPCLARWSRRRSASCLRSGHLVRVRVRVLGLGCTVTLTLTLILALTLSLTLTFPARGRQGPPESCRPACRLGSSPARCPASPQALPRPAVVAPWRGAARRRRRSCRGA